jgi:hypothetical protein
VPTNGLAPPDMPWLFTRPGQPNGLGPPALNYAAPPDAGGQTLGSAVADTGANAWQWLQDQRAESIRQGLLDPDTGLPTQKGLVDAARATAEGVMMGTTAPGIRAYHGSPHSFEAFDTSKIGTGEGAQAYGHGLYFAEGEGVARSYRDRLAPGGTPAVVKPDAEATAKYQDQWDDLVQQHRAALGEGWRTTPESSAVMAKMDTLHQQMVDDTIARNPGVLNPGHMYEVNIGADPEHFLHWDKPLSEQSPQVQEALKPLGFQSLKDAFSIRPVENGHVIDYIDNAGQPKTSSRVFPTQDAAEKAARVSFDTFGRNPTGAEIVSKNPGIELKLRDAGIPGIRYLDQGSRGAGEGTHNYVVFDPVTIEILRKYGIAGLIAGGGAAAAGTQQQQPTQ